MSTYFYPTLLGDIGIEEQQGAIVEVYLPNESITKQLNISPTPLTDEAAKQLNAYLAGCLKNFNLPLAPQGTLFQQTIWQLLCKIPYGKTISYKELASLAHRPKAVRAVGQANNKNPIPIFIPCHRVIGSNGQLVGYSGGLSMKETLLYIEKQ